MVIMVESKSFYAISTFFIYILLLIMNNTIETCSLVVFIYSSLFIIIVVVYSVQYIDSSLHYLYYFAHKQPTKTMFLFLFLYNKINTASTTMR